MAETKACYCRNLHDFIVLIGRIMLALLSSAVRCIVPKPKRPLKNEVVLITGSGSGLGRELALKFAELEAIVVLWDIDEKRALHVSSEIRELGGSSHVYLCDVSDEAQVKRVGKLVQDEVGDVTIVVNNAGLLQNVFFTDLDEAKIRKTLEVNILAHFWVNKFFFPRMLAQNKGHIVATSSLAGLLGWLYMADYCASKFAIVGMMEAIAEEVRIMGKADKIFFTTVCPLTMDTGMNQNPTTRLPFLVPIVNVKKAAADIVDAVQRGERLITVPRRFLYSIFLLRLFPRKVTQLILDFLQYNIVPHNSENTYPVTDQETLPFQA